MRHSGLQKEILRLYKELLTQTLKFSDPNTQHNLQLYIKEEFKKNSQIPKHHIKSIEYHLNNGKKYLNQLQSYKVDTKFSTYK